MADEDLHGDLVVLILIFVAAVLLAVVVWLLMRKYRMEQMKSFECTPPKLASPIATPLWDSSLLLAMDQLRQQPTRTASIQEQSASATRFTSTAADTSQIPSDGSLKSEGPPVSLKDGKVEPPKDAAASDKESHTVDTQPKKRGSSLTKCPGQTSPKEDDVTTKKPAQSKDDDARNAKTGQAEPQSETRDGAAQQGQPPPQLTGSQVGSPMDDPVGTATVGAGAKEQLQSQQEDKNNAAGAQLSGSVDADVGMSSEHRSTKGESRRRKSHKQRSSSAVGSGSQSLAQSELKSDPGVTAIFVLYWLLLRKLRATAVKPCGVDALGREAQPKRSDVVAPPAVARPTASGQPGEKPPVAQPTVVKTVASDILLPGRRIANAARHASETVSRVFKEETTTILHALSSGADAAQVPTDASLKPELTALSNKETKAESTKAGTASNTADDTRGTEPKSCSPPSQTIPGGQKSLPASSKDSDVTTEKPVQSKDEDARNDDMTKAQPSSLSKVRRETKLSSLRAFLAPQLPKNIRCRNRMTPPRGPVLTRLVLT
ncbi:hypothetical protein V5799_005102 [Amblyomma americanum]|uniref:Uncharacterized protein n=1 Tax=Amblyomma americanum TaxID=6943 RepID=A0AAQ4E070_AMBAM